MDDQVVTPSQGVLGDLAGLAAEGSDDASLAKRQHLRGMVLEALGKTDNDLRPDNQVSLLRDVLEGLTAQQRHHALEQARHIAHKESRNQTCFRVAAAAELLGLTDHDSFEKLKGIRRTILMKTPWADIEDSQDYNQTARKQQIRAALWLGAISYITGRRFRDGEMPEVLAEAICSHLANPDVRAELTAKYLYRPRESPPALASYDLSRKFDPELKPVIDGLGTEVVDEVGTWRNMQSPENDFLPVSWVTAEQSRYFGHWKHIRGDSNNEPIDLAGSFKDIGAVFKSVPSRRLVIVGKGGAGKTVLAYELAWQLVNARHEDEPVPLIFNVGTWDPQTKSLREWMVDELRSRYQAGRAKSDRDEWPTRLLKAGAILPILDGFDEIAPELRADASKGLDEGDVPEFVVTSRPDEFLEAARKAGQPVARTPVVELADLSLDQVEDYLRFSTLPTNSSDGGSAQWDIVLERMRAASQDDQGRRLLDVLSLPLMVFLARSIYRKSSANPQELLDSGRFLDTASVRSHLLDEYIPAMYEKAATGRRSTWDGFKDAHRWLGFLALCNVEQGTKSFAWWKPSRLMDAPIKKLVFYILATSPLLLVLGMAAAIAGLGFRESNASMSDSLINVASPALMSIGFLAIFTVLSFGPRFRPRTFVWWNASVRSRAGGTRFPSWRPFAIRELQYRKSDGMSISLFLLFSYLAATAFFRNPLGGLTVALFVIIPIVYSPRALSASSTPRALLRADLVASISKGVGYVIGTAIFSAGLWLTGRGVSGWIVVVACTLIVWFGTILSASGSWSIRRLGLAGGGHLPWKCMQFFDDAHERGILRLSGGAYEFRHAFIQNHLAKQHVGSFSDVDWPSKFAAADFMAGEVDSRATIALLRSLIEDRRRSDEKQRAADVWQLLINILREQGKYDEALHEVHSMKETDLASLQAVDYCIHRTLINILKEKGDTQGAKRELKALYGRLTKDERKISSSVTGPAKSFRVELDDDPTFDDLR